MDFEIMGETENWIALEKDNLGVEFKSNSNFFDNVQKKLMICFKDFRVLQEYVILKEIIQITSIRNMSHASVKFVFRRRIEYHVTKTFLQVFISYR